MASLAGKKVGEQIEKLTVGWDGTAAMAYSYGGGTVQGLTNYTNRISYVITDPTTSGWTGSQLVTDLLGMQKASRDAYHYGPWRVYFGTGWAKYLGEDFKAASDKSLKTRIEEIEGLEYGGILDYLNGTAQYDIIMVEMSQDVVRMVIGMDVTTLQWETNGGLMQHCKVMAIIVPQVRCDQNTNTGIVHGT
jgi:hypothetical protein